MIDGILSLLDQAILLGLIFWHASLKAYLDERTTSGFAPVHLDKLSVNSKLCEVLLGYRYILLKGASIKQYYNTKGQITL